MTAANKDFFEALSMLEHERGITAEYLIEKIKAAIIIAVKKNYEVEEDHIRVDIDPDTGRFDVALIQDIVADEDWYDEHAEIGVTEARKIRSSYEVGDRIITPLKTRDFGRIAAQTAKHVIRQGIREAERNQQLSEIQSRAHDIVQATVTRDVVNRSAKEWIVEVTIMEIKALLQDPSLDIKEVLNRLKFPSQSLLSRFFRKYTGISPTMYREQIQAFDDLEID